MSDDTVPEREPDEIDALVEYELTLPKFHDPYKFRVPCKMCDGGWHGLPRGDCPGYTPCDDHSSFGKMGA